MKTLKGQDLWDLVLMQNCKYYVDINKGTCDSFGSHHLSCRTVMTIGFPNASGSRLLSALLAWRRTSAREGRLTSHRDRYWIAAGLSFLPLRLEWVMRVFGSDKHQEGQHAYGHSYHEMFRVLRYRPIKLLEIGVLSGASLTAWRAFFPRAIIVGCDIRPKMQFNYRRIRTYLTDQSNPADLMALAAAEGPFDVIIDDGSHINAHQVTTLYNLFEHLRDGGTYVIEDTQTSYWPGPFGGAHVSDPAFAQTCTGEMLELAKYVNHAEFQSNEGTDPRRLAHARSIRRISFEHNMIILEKGNNTLPSNLPAGVVSS